MLAVGVWFGASVHRPGPLVAALWAVAVALVARRPAFLCVATMVLASVLGARAVAGLAPAPEGPFRGPVILVSDPETVGDATRVDVRAGAHRLEAWARGAAGARLQDLLAGEVVSVEGEVGPPADDAPWLAARHVVGELDVETVGRSHPGQAVVRLANQLRRTLAAGARPLPSTTEALFTGFVLGDDREISPLVVDDFRGSGLSHLLAVSGQNVAFVLALAAPLARRLPLGGRLCATIGVLSFFALLTRFEPSVLRATAMAGLAVLATAMGREASSLRLLALAVAGLVLVDPLLVRSVGFQLSVAASVGIVVLAAPVAARLPGPDWLRLPLAVTVSAQVAVAPVLLATFGGLPVAAVPANLLAAPAAGPITVWGLTGGVVAGLVPRGLATVLHLPTRALMGWVEVVAHTAAHLRLGEWGAVHLALLVLVGVLAAARHRRLAVALAFVVAVHPAIALRSPPPAQWVDADARVERRSGEVVLFLGEEARPAGVLAGLRRAGVERLDQVVLTARGPRRPGIVDLLRDRFGAEFRVDDAPCSFAACSPSGPTASTSRPVPS